MNREKILVVMVAVLITLLLFTYISPKVTEKYRQEGRVEINQTCITALNQLQQLCMDEIQSRDNSIVQQLKSSGYLVVAIDNINYKLEPTEIIK